MPIFNAGQTKRKTPGRSIIRFHDLPPRYKQKNAQRYALAERYQSEQCMCPCHERFARLTLTTHTQMSVDPIHIPEREKTRPKANTEFFLRRRFRMLNVGSQPVILFLSSTQGAATPPSVVFKLARLDVARENLAFEVFLVAIPEQSRFAVERGGAVRDKSSIHVQNLQETTRKTYLFGSPSKL